MKFRIFPFAELDEPVEDGTVAIVTGGAKGIGFAISRHLVKIGVHTIMGIARYSSFLLQKE